MMSKGFTMGLSSLSVVLRNARILAIMKGFPLGLNSFSNLATPKVLYIVPPSGPCRSVLMAAKELGVDLKTEVVDILKNEQFKPEFLKMNPNHSVPTLDDNGFYLWESRAITAYLANKYAPNSSVYPQDPEKRAVVDQMLYFDIGVLVRFNTYYFYPLVSQKGSKPDPEKEAEYKDALSLLNGLLEKTAYIADAELTLADLAIIGSLTFVEVCGYDFSPFPKVVEWMAKMKELPYYSEVNDQAMKDLKEYFQSLTQ